MKLVTSNEPLINDDTWLLPYISCYCTSTVLQLSFYSVQWWPVSCCGWSDRFLSSLLNRQLELLYQLLWGSSDGLSKHILFSLVAKSYTLLLAWPKNQLKQRNIGPLRALLYYFLFRIEHKIYIIFSIYLSQLVTSCKQITTQLQFPGCHKEHLSFCTFWRLFLATVHAFSVLIILW